MNFTKLVRGIQTSIREMCGIILELRKSDLKVTYQPYPEEDASGMVQNRITCPKKSKSELGFDYRINLEKGLDEFDSLAVIVSIKNSSIIIA